MCTHEYIVVVVDAAASVGVFVVVNAPATHGRPLFSPISSSGIYMSFQSAADYYTTYSIYVGSGKRMVHDIIQYLALR